MASTPTPPEPKARTGRRVRVQQHASPHCEQRHKKVASKCVRLRHSQPAHKCASGPLCFMCMRQHVWAAAVNAAVHAPRCSQCGSKSPRTLRAAHVISYPCCCNCCLGILSKKRKSAKREQTRQAPPTNTRAWRVRRVENRTSPQTKICLSAILLPQLAAVAPEPARNGN